MEKKKDVSDVIAQIVANTLKADAPDQMYVLGIVEGITLGNLTRKETA